MAFSPIDTKVNGCFQNSETSVYFEYAELSGKSWGSEHGAKHKIFLNDGFRYAIVKKTVVHVIIDENADGEPVWEKWTIKNNRVYS